MHRGYRGVRSFCGRRFFLGRGTAKKLNGTARHIAPLTAALVIGRQVMLHRIAVRDTHRMLGAFSRHADKVLLAPRPIFSTFVSSYNRGRRSRVRTWVTASTRRSLLRKVAVSMRVRALSRISCTSFARVSCSWGD